MKKIETGEDNFYDEIEGLLKTKPELKNDDTAFAWWIIRFLTGNPHTADKSVSGQKNDKNIDAIWLDDKRQIVNILQAKFRKKFGKYTEKLNELDALLNLTDYFYDSETRKSFVKKLNPKIVPIFNEAVERVTKRKYKICFHFVTPGKVSDNNKEEIQDRKDRKTGNPDYRIYDYKTILGFYEDWLDDMSPIVEDYTLPILTGRLYGDGVIHQSPENDTDEETWIFTASTTEIKDMYTKVGPQIFARNIRHSLGGTKINKALIATLKSEPENFWFFNNGITIICKDCDKKEVGRNAKLRIAKPQIINGLQTTVAIEQAASLNANVLVKVIKIPTLYDASGLGDSEFVSKIVHATNRQNPVNNEDLASNDRLQIQLWRNFKALGYLYQRKRGVSREADTGTGFEPHYEFNKKQLAKAVGASVYDPQIGRKGADKIFDKDGIYYDKIFTGKSDDYFLSCVMLDKYVVHNLYKIIKIKYPRIYSSNAKWLVMHFIWKNLDAEIKGGDGAEKFRGMWNERENRGKSFNSFSPAAKMLSKIIVLGYRMTGDFYRANKINQETGVSIDENTFYNSSKLWPRFSKFCSKGENRKNKSKFNKYVKDFKRELKKIQLK